MSESTPLTFLTIGQVRAILREELQKASSAPTQVSYTPDKTYVHGLSGLAELLGCSVQTAGRIKRSGIINDAISEIGRTITINAPKALDLLKQKRGRK